MKPISAFTLLSLLALSTTARADFLTGQVVNSLGVGIPGIDIDVKNLGSGGDPAIFNDGTDANGFFNTTIPNGLYRVTFTPPHAASSLALEIDDVVIVGTTDIGVVTLEAGVAVSGRLITEGGLPIAAINLDAVVASSGVDIDPLPMDTSNAFGQFTIIIPQETTEVQIKPNPLSGFAPRAFTVNSTIPVDLGDITLRPGFLLTAFLRNANTLAALTGVDLDVVNVVTKETLYTPGDNSTAGLLDVIVPAGTYDLEFCPNFATGLAPQGLSSVVVAGPVNVGNVDLPTGIVLMGTITDSMGMPLQGVDVDLNDAGTGAPVVLCSDNTNVSGAYSIRAPSGTYTVTFSATSQGYSDLIFPNVALTATTVLGGSMMLGGPGYASFCNGDGGDQLGCTDCPCTNNALAGSVGGCLNSAGKPTQLAASGSASVSLPTMSTSDLRFALSDAPANAFCILNSGDSIAPGGMANPCFGLGSGVQAASFDGLRCAVMNTRRHGGRSADASGNVGVTNNPWGGEGGPPVGLAIAGGGFLSGQTRFFQVIHRDDPLLSCMRGLNTSQAVQVTFTP